jgi:hypothetical protein
VATSAAAAPAAPGGRGATGGWPAGGRRRAAQRHRLRLCEQLQVVRLPPLRSGVRRFSSPRRSGVHVRRRERRLCFGPVVEDGEAPGGTVWAVMNLSVGVRHTGANADGPPATTDFAPTCGDALRIRFSSRRALFAPRCENGAAPARAVTRTPRQGGTATGSPGRAPSLPLFHTRATRARARSHASAASCPPPPRAQAAGGNVRRARAALRAASRRAVVRRGGVAGARGRGGHARPAHAAPLPHQPHDQAGRPRAVQHTRARLHRPPARRGGVRARRAGRPGRRVRPGRGRAAAHERAHGCAAGCLLLLACCACVCACLRVLCGLTPPRCLPHTRTKQAQSRLATTTAACLCAPPARCPGGG